MSGISDSIASSENAHYTIKACTCVENRTPRSRPFGLLRPDLKKRKLGIAEGECRIPTEAKSWGYSRLEYPQFSGAGANHTLENIG